MRNISVITINTSRSEAKTDTFSVVPAADLRLKNFYGIIIIEKIRKQSYLPNIDCFIEEFSHTSNAQCRNFEVRKLP
jgi:hypothetical protein